MLLAKSINAAAAKPIGAAGWPQAV